MFIFIFIRLDWLLTNEFQLDFDFNTSFWIPAKFSHGAQCACTVKIINRWLPLVQFQFLPTRQPMKLRVLYMLSFMLWALISSDEMSKSAVSQHHHPPHPIFSHRIYTKRKKLKILMHALTVVFLTGVCFWQCSPAGLTMWIN